MVTIISYESARDMLDTPAFFKGGTFVSLDGKIELFIQTAAEREAELARREEDEQITAMLKLVGLSKKRH